MPRNTVTRECHVGLYMAITHRILQCNCNLQPQPPLSSSFPCSWRFFSSPPLPSSSTLSIPPSFFLNLSLHPLLLFFLSTPNLTTGPSSAISKHQKQRKIVALREPSTLFKPINYFPLGRFYTDKF